MLSKIYVAGTITANTTALDDAGVALLVQDVAYIELTKIMTTGYFYEVKVNCNDGTTVSQSVECR